jgi:hypothetical protein
MAATTSMVGFYRKSVPYGITHRASTCLIRMGELDHRMERSPERGEPKQ